MPKEEIELTHHLHHLLILDVALSIHPHPTLAESEEEAAEAFLGSATHIFTGIN
jgi:hypothetical protein